MGIFGAQSRRRTGKGRAEPQLFSSRRAPLKAAPRRKPLVFRIMAWGVMLCLWALIGLAGLTVYVWFSLDQQGLFKVPEREPGMILLASNGEVIAERGTFFGDEIRLDEVPSYVPQAIIAIEDRRYHSHFGIDPVGLARATVANFRAGRIVEGGSTITQQLAKNLFLKPERTVERKLQELVLALWLEAKYSKDDILQLYLNRVYYGAGAVGIEKAAQKYFRKSAREVTLGEAAILAGVLKAPATYNPINHPKAARARANEVIRDMVAEGFVTPDEAEEALTKTVAAKPVEYVSASHYLVDWVAEQIPELIGVLDQSIIVETTLDQNLQRIAEKAVRQRVIKEGGKLNVSQGAAVVLDMRGAVLAMVGGKSYIRSQFNRAVKAKRQPGSSFKPFVYLTALDQGMTPDSVEIDEPVRFGNWEPENYRRKYLGRVSLKKAMALSLNTVAAKLAVAVGPQNVITTAHRLGINSELVPNASIALGTSEVTLLEMTSAFAPFANGGSAVVPYVVTRIISRDGTIIYERRGDGLGMVVDGWSVGAMNTMLREVIRSGTGKRAGIENQDVAGKTGTSQDYRDAWFLGYSAYLVCGVWIGNDDNSPTDKVTGGGLPASIWKDIMEPAHAGLDYANLPGEYQTVAHRQSQGGLFDIFRDMLGRHQEEDEFDQLVDDVEARPRRRQRLSDELRKQRERR
ncbi:MAG TPA: PBP1A family penicillin-binding protein [Aestuariivirgaceae bacterium]|jgi:penicillin-binding protein 1A